MDLEQLEDAVLSMAADGRTLTNYASTKGAQSDVHTCILMGLVNALGHMPEIAAALEASMEHAYSTHLALDTNEVSVRAFEARMELFRSGIRFSRERAAAAAARTQVTPGG